MKTISVVSEDHAAAQRSQTRDAEEVKDLSNIIQSILPTTRSFVNYRCTGLDLIG